MSFEQFENSIDIAHRGIIQRNVLPASAVIGMEPLDNDLRRLPPVGMIALAFLPGQTSAAFGRSFTQPAAVNADKKSAVFHSVGIRQGDAMICWCSIAFSPMLRHSRRIVFYVQFDTEGKQGASGNFKGGA